MAKDKKQDITVSNKTANELKTMLLDLRRAQFNLRFRKSQGNLEKPSEIRHNRRAIARIKTQLTIQANQAQKTKSKG
ncbi:MAG: 50S ribosomal protein L29 [Alphaproteobacteria bacterium]|nr:50S ribosomal protein L29 [Alphaproteobacteria bacterium]